MYTKEIFVYYTCFIITYMNNQLYNNILLRHYANLSPKIKINIIITNYV